MDLLELLVLVDMKEASVLRCGGGGRWMKWWGWEAVLFLACGCRDTTVPHMLPSRGSSGLQAPTDGPAMQGPGYLLVSAARAILGTQASLDRDSALLPPSGIAPVPDVIFVHSALPLPRGRMSVNCGRTGRNGILRSPWLCYRSNATCLKVDRRSSIAVLERCDSRPRLSLPAPTG